MSYYYRAEALAAARESAGYCEHGRPDDEPCDERPAGFYVMKWGGGRYTSVAWFAHRKEAEAEVSRILLKGAWNGMPPRVEE